MQLINFKNQTISGQYDVNINPIEVDIFESESQKIEYLVAEDVLPDGIRCNMLMEFETEHGVEYGKCKNPKWSIVEMQNPEYYLSVSCADQSEKDHERMTMVKVSLTESEVEILEHFKSNILLK